MFRQWLNVKLYIEEKTSDASGALWSLTHVMIEVWDRGLATGVIFVVFYVLLYYIYETELDCHGSKRILDQTIDTNRVES